MKYFLGGYYLIKLRPINFGTKIGEQVYTCSDCINDNLIDMWSYSWATDNDKQVKEAKENFNLTDNDIIEIRNWVDKKHNDNIVGWANVFTELESAIEYKSTYFPHLEDIKIIALYFDENETKDILVEFKPQSETNGEIGLRLTLLKQIEETKNANEELLGYDLIGIELGGSFHTFHCHDIESDLSTEFGLKLNKYGLFDEIGNWKIVTDYLNDENNGLEPVPWFIAKTKLIT